MPKAIDSCLAHRNEVCSCLVLSGTTSWLYWHEKSNLIQAVLNLHGSLTTQFSKQHRFFWYSQLSFVHVELNQSSAFMVFCLMGCFFGVSKNRSGPLYTNSSLIIPVPIQSLKLFSFEPVQYFDGWLPRNTKAAIIHPSTDEVLLTIDIPLFQAFSVDSVKLCFYL